MQNISGNSATKKGTVNQIQMSEKSKKRSWGWRMETIIVASMPDFVWMRKSFFFCCALPSAISYHSPLFSCPELWIAPHSSTAGTRESRQAHVSLSSLNKAAIIHDTSVAFSRGSFWAAMIFRQPWLAVVDIWEEDGPSARTDNNQQFKLDKVLSILLHQEQRMARLRYYYYIIYDQNNHRNLETCKTCWQKLWLSTFRGCQSLS